MIMNKLKFISPLFQTYYHVFLLFETLASTYTQLNSNSRNGSLHCTVSRSIFKGFRVYLSLLYPILLLFLFSESLLPFSFDFQVLRAFLPTVISIHPSISKARPFALALSRTRTQHHDSE